MGVLGTLLVNMKANTAAFNKGMNRSRRSMGMVARQAQMLKSSMLKLGAAYVGFRGIKKGIGFARESVQLWGRQELAVKKLSDALTIMGKGGPGPVKNMEEFAAALQRITVVSDESILEMAGLGASLGKLSDKGLKAAVVASIGLSRSLDMDLTSAMRLIGRAAQGNTETFSRYGLTFDKTMTSQEKFFAVLQRGINDFAIAKGEADTFSGSIQQMHNRWGDLKERLGKALVPMLSVIMDKLESLEPILINASDKFGEFVNTNVHNMGEWVTSVENGVDKIHKAFNTLARYHYGGKAKFAQLAQRFEQWFDYKGELGFKSIFGVPLESKIWIEVWKEMAEESLKKYRAISTTIGGGSLVATIKRMAASSEKPTAQKSIADYIKDLSGIIYPGPEGAAPSIGRWTQPSLAPNISRFLTVVPGRSDTVIDYARQSSETLKRIETILEEQKQQWDSSQSAFH